VEDERTYHIANKLMIPCAGCPVICHGLVSASHLNGMLGEVRLPKKDESRTRLSLEVHFEKKGVKSALVKPENLYALHLSYRAKVSNFFFVLCMDKLDDNLCKIKLYQSKLSRLKSGR